VDSNRALVGLLGRVGRLELVRRSVVEVAVDPVVVEPVNPSERRQLDVLEAAP
jgi:hypothetical protein